MEVKLTDSQKRALNKLRNFGFNYSNLITVGSAGTGKTAKTVAEILKTKQD